MITLAKRIALFIDSATQQQGGVIRVAAQSVVLVLTATMALCTVRPYPWDAAGEAALFGGTQAIEHDNHGRPS